MRVIVANPPGILDNGKYIVPFPSRCDWVGSQPAETSYYPYDLGYFTSMLKLAGIEARLFDGQIGSIPADVYTNAIAAQCPDVLVCECGHLSYPTMTRIMQDLKLGLNIKAILCGPFGTAYPERARADGWDVVIPGEFQYKALAEIMGRAWPDEPIDPNTLPFPDDEDCPRINYWEQSNIVKPMIQVYATRGCTMRCEFCTTPLYYGGYDNRGYVLTRGFDNVCAEIEYLKERYPQLEGIFFDEENHAGDIKWLRGFANRLIERGLNSMVYEAMCGYWTLKQEDIELLARAGYKKLRFGVESLATSEAGGKSGKHVAAQRLQNVLTWCKANEITTHLYTMIGVPGSSEDGDIETLRSLIGFKAHDLVESIQHSICTPNPGTRLFEQCRANGWLASDDPQNYHWHSPVIDRPEYPAARVQVVSNTYYHNLGLRWEVVK